MYLWEKGLVDLDEDISDYFSDDEWPVKYMNKEKVCIKFVNDTLPMLNYCIELISLCL